MIETGVSKTLVVEIYPLNITVSTSHANPQKFSAKQNIVFNSFLLNLFLQFVRKGMHSNNTWTTTVSRAEKIRRFKTTKLGFRFNMAPHQMAMR